LNNLVQAMDAEKTSKKRENFYKQILVTAPPDLMDAGEQFDWGEIKRDFDEGGKGYTDVITDLEYRIWRKAVDLGRKSVAAAPVKSDAERMLVSKTRKVNDWEVEVDSELRKNAAKRIRTQIAEDQTNADLADVQETLINMPDIALDEILAQAKSDAAPDFITDDAGRAAIERAQMLLSGRNL